MTGNDADDTTDGGIRPHKLRWLNGLTHPITGQLLQGESWNPVTGCTAVSQGCINCWARRTSTTRLRGKGLNFQHFSPHFYQGRLSQPLRWRKPRAVFTCGMGDLFHEQFTDKQIAAIFGVMAQAHQHLFIILTKRIQRALEGAQWWLYDATIAWPLPHVWLLASIENQETADERIPQLLQVPAALHGVSLEPMLGPVDLHLEAEIMFDGAPDFDGVEVGTRADILQWVICGGENGPGARPCDSAWVRSIRDQCVAADVLFYFKGYGTQGGRRGRELDGRRWEETPR